MCECCKAWHHAACVGLTEDEIAAFALLGPKAHWYCDKCNAGAKELYVQHVEFKSRLDKLEKTVSDVKSENKNLNKDISKLKIDTKKDRDDIDQLFAENKNIKIENNANSDLVKNIDQSVTELKTQQAKNTESLTNLKATIHSEVDEVIKKKLDERINELNFPTLLPTDTNTNNDQAPARNISTFKEFINTQCAERDEIMKRKNQLMIFNFKEAGNPEADKKQTHELLNLLQIDEEIQIEDFTRMGKSREGKHKPLRITLNNVSIKRKILAKASKLREVPSTDRFAFVYIKPNLTVQQWKDSKNLQEDLRVRRLADPSSNLKISRGKIVKVPNPQ